MVDFEQRIESIEKQLAGVYDLLKTLVEAHSTQEEQSLEGFKILTEIMNSILTKLEDHTQHSS